jgi:hypothetical protein
MSISPLMVNWANMIGEQIINVEPVVAEIRMYFKDLFSVVER